MTVQPSTQTKDAVCVGVEWVRKYACVSLLDPILGRLRRGSDDGGGLRLGEAAVLGLRAADRKGRGSHHRWRRSSHDRAPQVGEEDAHRRWGEDAAARGGHLRERRGRIRRERGEATPNRPDPPVADRKGRDGERGAQARVVRPAASQGPGEGGGRGAAGSEGTLSPPVLAATGARNLAAVKDAAARCRGRRLGRGSRRWRARRWCGRPRRT